MFRTALAIFTYILCALVVTSQEVVHDSVTVYFRVAKHDLDPDFKGNGERLGAIADAMTRLAEEGTPIDSILITAYASPEGPSDFNAALAKRRLNSLKQYLTQQVGIDSDLIKHAGDGVAWDALVDDVTISAEVPCRDRVLDILINTPVWVYGSNGNIVDSRKRQLMNLNGGVPYRWLLTNIFPRLRNSAAIVVHARYPKTVDTVSTARANIPDISPVVPVADPEDVDPLPVEEIVPAIAESVEPHTPLHRFALKTNFIYDAIVMPSLEFEWHINDRWSAAVEGNVAWWKYRPKHKYYQLMTIIPEVRYWFKTTERWHGMYGGVFAGGGKYDLENGGTGYKGEGGMAGVSFGYMWPIGRNLSLEAAIGVGLMYTRYREYIPLEGHYVYQYTRSLFYGGPTKIKFAIAWRFYDINRKKGGGKEL